MHRGPFAFALIELPAASRSERRAFTLIELLVVIAVILVLAGLAMPAMTNAIALASRASCVNQLRQIGVAFKAYQGQYAMWSHKAPNWGLWEKPLGTALAPGDPDAYWGVAYAPFVGNDREVFRCPNALKMWSGAGRTDWANQPQVTYGFNVYVSNKVIPAKFRDPSQTIQAQDAYEHLLDANGDMLFIRPGDVINLAQWRHIPGAVYEYFRHVDTCNTLWLDAHVTAIPECTEYPRKAYTGQ